MPTRMEATMSSPELEHDSAPDVPTTPLEDIETYDRPVTGHDDVEEPL